MGVNPALEDLAQYIVEAQAAYSLHDGSANDVLQAFWAAKAALDPGTLATYANDITKLDAYSHRILGFEYFYQTAFLDPADIPANLAQEIVQFQLSVSEFTAAGYPTQAADDQNVLNQAAGWAQQTSDAWIDSSYLASVKQVILQDVAAAGNLISSAAGSFFGAIPTSYLVAGGLVLAALVYLSWKK
jgi:hypothetical protein